MTTASALAERVDLAIHAGSDTPITVSVTGNDDEPVWLDTWTSKLIVARNKVTAKLILTSADGDIDHYPDTGAVNELVVHLDADDTRLLQGDYDYELKGTDGDGNEYVLMWGTLTVQATADRSEA